MPCPVPHAPCAVPRAPCPPCPDCGQRPAEQGEWGPYLYCNPVNASDEITGPWHCQVELTASSGGGPPPPQCAAANFSTYGSYCWKGLGKPTTVNGLSEGDCCSKAGQEGITKWNYLSATKECQLFKLAFTTEPCKGGVLGYKEAGPPSTPPCNCSRVHKTVGKENLTVSFGCDALRPLMALCAGRSHRAIGGVPVVWLCDSLCVCQQPDVNMFASPPPPARGRARQGLPVGLQGISPSGRGVVLPPCRGAVLGRALRGRRQRLHVACRRNGPRHQRNL